MKSKNIFARHALSKIGECIALLFLGIILGFLLSRIGAFEFDLKVNALNFLTVLLTFVVTFHLQQTLTHRTSDDRIEKQIIISQLQVLEVTLRKIADICRASALGEAAPTEARAVLLEFRTFNNQLDTLQRLFDLTPMKPDGARIAELRRGGLTIKQVATRGAFPNAALPPEVNRDVQSRITALSESIFAAIFYVNRL